MSKPTTYQDFTQAIGEMTVAFQELEGFLLCLFALLNNQQDQRAGHIIGSKLSFRNLTEITGALVKHRVNDKNITEGISELLKKMAALEHERNTYIHSFYPTFCFGDSTEVLGRFKHKINKNTGYALHCDDADAEKVRGLAFECNSCIRELLELTEELSRGHGISTRKPLEE